eukprot:scaffold1229_cov193-Alexandrium_tamarense.AAC.22
MAGFVVENVFLEDLEIEEPSKNQTCTDINLEIHSKGLAQAFEFAAVESRIVGEGNCGSSFRDFLSAKGFKLDA